MASLVFMFYMGSMPNFAVVFNMSNPEEVVPLTC